MARTSGASCPVTWKVDATETPVVWCDANVANTCADVGDHYSNTAAPCDGVVPVRFRAVVWPPNVPPTVNLTAPVNGASVVAGSTITRFRQRRRQRRNGVVGDVPRRSDADRPGHDVAL
jgi:hypothetical protein